ncbi:hypothetical protein MMC30_003254 [Trapelia coarctata]|nr:hypothetical protein [Trapelia coarctata]
MADGMGTLDDMAPLERIPSHSADPTPVEIQEMGADSSGSKQPLQHPRSFHTIPAGPPGNGACYRQSRSNPKPHEVLILSPIKSESEAATPRGDTTDIDPLSLSTAYISDDSGVQRNSGPTRHHESDDNRSPDSPYIGYYSLTTTPEKTMPGENCDTGSSHIPTTDKENSRQSSCTTVADKGHSSVSSGTVSASTGPATPVSGWVGLRGDAVPFRPVEIRSFPCVQGMFPGEDPHSLDKPDTVAADTHPLEPWRRRGTEIIDFEPGQSPIDALFRLGDEGCLRSQKADSAMVGLDRESNYSPGFGEPGETADSAMAEFVEESNFSPGGGELARKFRRPSIMAMSESAASDSSEVGDGRSWNGPRASSWNGTRTWSWVLSETDEETDLLHRIKLLRDTSRKREVHLSPGHNIPSRTDGLISVYAEGYHRTGTVAKHGHQRRHSILLSRNEERRPFHRGLSYQQGIPPTCPSRLDGWPFTDLALDEAQATFKKSAKWEIWDDMEESLRGIMRALTVKTSRIGANVWDNVPSWGLADTPDETTTDRFRDRGQCAVVAIHRFMCVTQESLRLLDETRSIQMYERTICNEWESASTRSLLAVLAAEIACNGYMSTIVQGEDESLPFREARITGDTKEALRKRAQAAYDITEKLRALFLTLDMRLGWVSKNHEEKHEAATRLFDTALEAGLIDPSWWRNESKENIVRLEKVLFSSM